MDRRTVWAILLMMVIAIAPALFLKKPKPSVPKSAAGEAAAPRAGAAAKNAAPAARAAAQPRVAPDTVPRGVAAAPPGATSDTVWVTSPLYRFGVTTRGARLVNATLARYKSMAPADSGRLAQILPRNSDLLGLTLVRG